jgi:hypothetical protein
MHGFFSLKIRSRTPDFTGKCGVVLPIFNDFPRLIQRCQLKLDKEYGEERETRENAR